MPYHLHPTGHSHLPGLTALSVVAALALFSGPVVAHDAACNVTSAVFTGHIEPRHCDTGQYTGKSKFISAYCTGVTAAQSFCGMVQNHAGVTRTVQGDGRVRYDANLGLTVGRDGEQCGRVIINSTTDGTVVTQFPEMSC